jgi:hypothetical protein
MEVAFWNRLRHLRCTWSIGKSRIGPAHASNCVVTVTVKRGEEEWCASGVAPKDKAALRQAILALEVEVDEIPDPCYQIVMYEKIWEMLPPSQRPSVVLFEPPPSSWFSEPQELGVDWEGQPPCIVQIACKQGVYIDDVSSNLAKRILADSRHTHYVFGAHEVDLVSNPVNLQTDPFTSLAEYISLSFMPEIRLLKDKSIHIQTNWSSRPLSDRAVRYAALDAFLTRRLGISKK